MSHSNKSLVVYNALTDGYDKLEEPEHTPPGVDFFCFSNDVVVPKDSAWRVLPIPLVTDSKPRLIRYPKLNPHLFLKDYESSLWVDSNISVTKELIDRAFGFVESGSICAMLPHSLRSCVYLEALEALRGCRGDPLEIRRQISFLLKERFPANAGLKECCIIFRRHNHPKVIEFSELWWKMLVEFSTRDQLGVGYALKRAGLVPEDFAQPDILKRVQRPHLPARVVQPCILRRLRRFVNRNYAIAYVKLRSHPE